MPKISFEKFYERVVERHGDTFSINESDFVTMKDPLTIVCNVHNIAIPTTGANVTYHNPCKKCIRDKKFEKYVPKVLKAMAEHFPDFELMSEISDFNCEVTIFCPKHGNYTTKADKIIFNETNCRKCGNERGSKTRTGSQRVSFSEFKQRFTERYGSKLVLLSTEADYKNYESELRVSCSDPSHPAFSKSAKDLMRFQGCKKCKESVGERLTRIALEQLGIEYEQEKRFASCRDKKELPFDFWLPEHTSAIEYQGRQHSIPAERFGGVKALSATQKRDEIKRKWAEENGVNLIYVHGVKEIKKIILRNLPSNSEFDTDKILKNIEKQEKEWIDSKWADYLKKLNGVHQGAYDFSKTTWTWGQKKISYICPIHGERSGYLDALLKGHVCSLCAGTELTLIDVIDRSREKFQNKFDFSKSDFQGMEVEMEIICEIHGSIFIEPERHLYLTRGCRKCSPKAEDFSPENFLKKAKEKFDERFDYSEMNYQGREEKIKIICRQHNETFNTRPGDHIRHETGACPICKREHFRKIKSKPIEVEGINYPSIKAAAEKYGLKPQTASKRLRDGWGSDKAFTTPLANK